VPGDPAAITPGPNIGSIRDTEVLGRGHVTEEIGAGSGGDGPADGGGNVVVAGGDIGSERPRR